MAKERRNRDIKNLFVVLGSATICALLLSYFFIYYYGPSGRYQAGNTLVDPYLIGRLEEGEKVRFVFDQFEFTYFDKKAGKIVAIPIQLEQYRVFYWKISSLLSLEPTMQIEQFFMNSHPTLLTTNLKSLEGGKDRIFQVVEFVEENYFRVNLHGNGQDSWAYFYQPELYREIFHLFKQVL